MSGNLKNERRWWTQNKSRVWSCGQQFHGFCLGLKHHATSEHLGYVPAATWRETGLASVLCTSGSSSKAKVGTLLCFKARVQCPNPCPDYILLPKGQSFFPLSAPAEHLCPFSHLTSSSHGTAWWVRFCMFSWLISQSQHVLVKAREGMKAQLVDEGCRDWGRPIWQQPTDAIIWFVKRQPR